MKYLAKLDQTTEQIFKTLEKLIQNPLFLIRSEIRNRKRVADLNNRPPVLVGL